MLQCCVISPSLSPFSFNSILTYLTTSPFSSATFPRRTNAVTSVRLPTPRFASSRSRRNISTFGCFCLLAPVAAGTFFDEDVFSSFSLAKRLLLLLLLPPVLRVRRPCDGWWPWRMGWWKMKEEQGDRKRANLYAAGDVRAVTVPIDASVCKGKGVREAEVSGGEGGEVGGKGRVGIAPQPSARVSPADVRHN